MRPEQVFIARLLNGGKKNSCNRHGCEVERERERARVGQEMRVEKSLARLSYVEKGSSAVRG